MKKRRRKVLPRSGINITPFIDILLVLLVIFMALTPLTPAGLRTNVPQAPPPGEKETNQDKVVVLSLDGNGTIRINQNEVEPSRLIERLQEIYKTRNDRTIFVQADESLLFNDVAHLMDAAKAGGVDRIGLMTERISSKR